MSTTELAQAHESARVSALEAELAALRESSALAHRQLHEAMSAEIAALQLAHENLHRAHAKLQVEREMERRERKRQHEKVKELRAKIAGVRRDRNAALAAAKRRPGLPVVAAARRVIRRASRSARRR